MCAQADINQRGSEGWESPIPTGSLATQGLLAARAYERKPSFSCASKKERRAQSEE